MRPSLVCFVVGLSSLDLCDSECCLVLGVRIVFWGFERFFFSFASYIYSDSFIKGFVFLSFSFTMCISSSFSSSSKISCSDICIDSTDCYSTSIFDNLVWCLVTVVYFRVWSCGVWLRYWRILSMLVLDCSFVLSTFFIIDFQFVIGIAVFLFFVFLQKEHKMRIIAKMIITMVILSPSSELPINFSAPYLLKIAS